MKSFLRARLHILKNEHFRRNIILLRKDISWSIIIIKLMTCFFKIPLQGLKSIQIFEHGFTTDKPTLGV